MKVYKGYQIFCVADGCGWGERPKEASNRLKDSFLDYFEGKTFKTLKEISTHLVHACAFANHCISYGKEDIWMAGTSTALGGLIVELEEKKKKKKNETNNVPPWAFVFLSIGDCKCFKWDCALKTCTDITAGNRVHVTDARDPGGRLGPQKKDGQPDLRNLDMFWVGCNEGDIIMTMSDGVHDNLDPQTLGHVPSEFGQKVDSWDDIDPKLCTDIKTKFMNDLITKIITTDISEVPQSFMNDPLPLSNNTEARPVTPALITKRLVRYCLKLTRNAREWMEQNPNGTLESDYQKYPGKLDHTTCVACMVGTHEPNVEEDDVPDNGQTSSLRPEVWPY
uniref:PPM-type phosphatase domain-containing protein n=1 Tax=Arcella intermedia TaxID=1963864 RepID=A0A6B2L696_9EUKA